MPIFTVEDSHRFLRMANCKEPTANDLECFTSHLGHPYVRHEQFFAVNATQIYKLMYWTTLDKDGVERVCTATLWRMSISWCKMLRELPASTALGVRTLLGIEVTKFFNGDLLTDIENEDVIRYLKQQTMDMIFYGFTTNDVAAFSSFTMTNKKGFQGAGRCVEHSVMCMAKSKINKEQTLQLPGITLKAIALKSKFAQPHVLRAILNKTGNDARFDDGILPQMSEESKREYKIRELASIREEIAVMDPEMFKSLYLQWLDLNFELDPTSTPSKFKKLGSSLLFSDAGIQTWDRMAGTLFLLATSKIMDSTFNAHLVLAMDPDVFVAEITPDDGKYGIIPPEGQRLDIVKTPQGKAWMMSLMQNHAVRQTAFIRDLQDAIQENSPDGDEKALNMLTCGLRDYKHGMLGTIKRVYLNIVHERLRLSLGLKMRISQLLDPFKVERLFHDSSAGVSDSLDWFFVHPCTKLDTTSRDPSVLFDALGVDAKHKHA